MFGIINSANSSQAPSLVLEPKNSIAILRNDVQVPFKKIFFYIDAISSIYIICRFFCGNPFACEISVNVSFARWAW